MWDFEEGEILAFDKPLHWTSFDLVAKVRYNLCRKLEKKKLKVGHSGTLDPLATGVVIICTGKKTKMIETLQYDVKEYIATLQLGATTPSYDMEKEVDSTYPTEHITRALIDGIGYPLAHVTRVRCPCRGTERNLVNLYNPDADGYLAVIGLRNLVNTAGACGRRKRQRHAGHYTLFTNTLL